MRDQIECCGCGDMLDVDKDGNTKCPRCHVHGDQ